MSQQRMTPPEDTRPAFMEADERARLDEWKASPEFATARAVREGDRYSSADTMPEAYDHGGWVPNPHQGIPSGVSAGWDAERAAITLPDEPVPNEPEATAFLAGMLDREAAGTLEWHRDDWREPPPPWTGPPGDFQPISEAEMLARIEQVTERKPTRAANGDLRFRCPAHDDRNPSAWAKRGDRWWLLRCHRGCTWEAMVEALGWEPHQMATRGDP